MEIEPTRPTRVRHVILALLCLSTMIAYLTRIISAATGSMQAEYRLDDIQMGDVLAAFALGYFWFQVPGGLFASWIGVRIVFPVIAVLWSLACLGMTIAPGEAGLRWSRIALGVAQAGLVPCCAQALSEWFPARDRGIASAIAATGMQIGAVLGTALTAWLLSYVGWRHIFAVYSVTGLVWAVAFALIYRERPELHPLTNEAERALIRAGQTPVPVGSSAPAAPFWQRGLVVLLAILASFTMWVYCIQAFCRAFGYDFFTTWFPTYLERSRGVSLVNAGLLTTVPLVGFGVGGVAGGIVVDLLYRRTGSKWISRCGVASVSLAISAASMLAAAVVQDSRSLVSILGLGSFFAAVAGASTWAVALDIGGKQTALIAGIMNLAGNVGAYYCPIVVAQLFTMIESGRMAGGAAASSTWVPFTLSQRTDDAASRYNLILYTFAAVYVLGAVVWLFVNPNRKVVDDVPASTA